MNLERIRKSTQAAPPLTPLTAAQEKTRLQKWILAELVVMVVGLFSANYLMTAKVHATQKVVHQARASLPQTISATNAMGLNQLNQEELGLTRKIAFLTSLVNQRVYWTNKMNEIAKTVPENIQLTLLDYTDDEDANGRNRLSLKIEGDLFINESGSDLEMANRFVDALKQNQEFMRGLAEIKINSLRKVAVRDRAGVHFDLVCAGIPNEGAG